jgi:hypothetical protein
MACATLHFQSPARAKACSMTVLVPERTVGTPPFPVCYLLHGLSDDHTSWARRTSIERHVADLPLLVVMPDGGRGFYCRSYWIPGSYAPSIVREAQLLFKASEKEGIQGGKGDNNWVVRHRQIPRPWNPTRAGSD